MRRVSGTFLEGFLALFGKVFGPGKKASCRDVLVAKFQCY